jgi:hypothetical protein
MNGDDVPATAPPPSHEVTIMNESTNPPDHNTTLPSHRFHKLPDSIRLEDTIATHPASLPPDPSMGRDTERDFMLRNAGGWPPTKDSSPSPTETGEPPGTRHPPGE